MQEVFVPQNTRSLRSTYPELNNYPEFDKLPDKELKFCWWFACQSSPLVHGDVAIQNDQKRAIAAAERVWGANLSQKKYKEISSLDFDSRMIVAIEKMTHFQAGNRSKAKLAIEKAFDNLVEIAKTPLSEIKEISDKRAYVSTIKEINDLLPKVVRRMEEGFGVSETSGKPGKDGEEAENLMDDVLSQSGSDDYQSCQMEIC